MRRAGQIALLRFPGTDLSVGKLRPVVLIAPTPGPYDDWLVCMVSTQFRQVDAARERHARIVTGRRSSS